MALAFEQAQVHKRICLKNALEMRLLKISEEYNLKYTEGCARTSNLTSEMNGKLDAVKAQLGENPSSEEYRQNMSECESIENEYQTMIQAVQDQMNIAEQTMQRMQEVVETQLEVVNSEIEQWKEALTHTIETTCGYFQGN